MRGIGLRVGALVVIVACTGCAMTSRRVGAEGTEGATEAFRREVRELPPEEQGILGERAAAGVVRGAFDQLDDPKTRDQFEAAIERAVFRALHAAAYGSSRQDTGTGGSGPSDADIRPLLDVIGRRLSAGIVSGAAAQVERELGADGQGPLADVLASSGQRLAASTVSGAQQQLFGQSEGCGEDDPFECAKRRAHDLGHSAATGAISAVRWWIILGAFALGFMMNAAARDAGHLARWVGRRLRRRAAR